MTHGTNARMKLLVGLGLMALCVINVIVILNDDPGAKKILLVGACAIFLAGFFQAHRALKAARSDRGRL